MFSANLWDFLSDVSEEVLLPISKGYFDIQAMKYKTEMEKAQRQALIEQMIAQAQMQAQAQQKQYVSQIDNIDINKILIGGIGILLVILLIKMK